MRNEENEESTINGKVTEKIRSEFVSRMTTGAILDLYSTLFVSFTFSQIAIPLALYAMSIRFTNNLKWMRQK